MKIFADFIHFIVSIFFFICTCTYAMGEARLSQSGQSKKDWKLQKFSFLGFFHLNNFFHAHKLFHFYIYICYSQK